MQVRSKPWTEALRRVLTQLELRDGNGNITCRAGEALRLIAERCVMDAIAGDKAAREEIAQRLDGKSVEHYAFEKKDPRSMTNDELATEILRRRATEADAGEDEPAQLH